MTDPDLTELSRRRRAADAARTARSRVGLNLFGACGLVGIYLLRALTMGTDHKWGLTVLVGFIVGWLAGTWLGSIPYLVADMLTLRRIRDGRGRDDDHSPRTHRVFLVIDVVLIVVALTALTAWMAPHIGDATRPKDAIGVILLSGGVVGSAMFDLNRHRKDAPAHE